MANQASPPDMELGNLGSADIRAQPPSREVIAIRLGRRALQFKPFLRRKASNNTPKHRAKIEDYRKGYPRFSALMASHGSFHIFRRFSNLRVRLLLLKQDKLSLLESRLNKIDREEPSPLFLACSRMDQSVERTAVLQEIEKALATYDQLLDRCQRVFSFESPRPLHVSSIENWLEGNACIARDETKFLGHEGDLLTIAPVEDSVLHSLELFVSSSLAYFKKGHLQNRSGDDMVHVFAKGFTNRVTRVLLMPLITFILLAPIILCNSMSSSTNRLIVLVFAAIAFISAVSFLTASRPIDIATCSATYLAVLIAFINSPTKSQD
ncbi:hypothetical protein F4810DRAFT_565382 [Camillea tinctor]|nr:hypothetical protein F4810DRAFT_565382 [Camillea tinctor]